MDKDVWYSPSQCLRFYPSRTIFMLQNYTEFLHRGVWPPEHKEGCEARNRTYKAPFELVSGIAGELRWRLGQHGHVGQAIFEIYAYGLSLESRARLMQFTPFGLRTEMGKVLRAISEEANPANFNERCPCCGEFMKAGHVCPKEEL